MVDHRTGKMQSATSRCQSLWILFAFFLFLVGRNVRGDEWVYTARVGDTLWDLAGEYTKGINYWSRLQVLNHIADPRKIPPGTRIRIPVDWLKFEPVSVRVIQIFGDNEVVPAGGGGPQPAREGMELHSGDQVHTGADGSMSLEFADGSKVLVRPQSRLVFDSLRIFPPGTLVDIRLRLEQGAIESQVVSEPQGMAPRFRINTPAAVAAVRGTDFRVGAEPYLDRMRNETLAGNVEVSGVGVRRLVPGGFGVYAEIGKPPQPARILLDPPDLAQLPDVVEQVPLRFTWTRRPEESAYRAQIAPDRLFQKLLADRHTTLSTAEFGDLPDGDYVLRVRGIDEVGLEGLDATHVFTVNARPEPPVGITPDDGSNVYTRRPKFWWSKPEQAARYHLQLASDAQFTRPLRDLHALKANELEWDRDLPLGRYFWRIATIDMGRDQGPYGDVQSFNIKDPPKAPESPEALMADQAINFKWKVVQDAERYHFQLAEDREFKEVVIDRHVPENKIVLTQDDLDSGGDYFFRIRAINHDGASGAYSTIHEIEIPSKISPLWLLVIPLVLIPVLL